MSTATDPREAILAGDPCARWPAEEVAAYESWHHRCVERTFDGRSALEPWGRLLWTPEIDEPDWNHATGICWRPEELENTLATAGAAFAALGRAPVIAATPWSAPADLGARLAARGWRVAFRHLWSIFDLARPVAVEPVAPYRYTRVETAAEMEEFVALFVSVYGADGALAPGYAPALRRSLSRPGVRHQIVRLGDEPVAIATLLVEGERSQFFNMVVADGHRGRGLAEWLTAARLAEARAAGACTLTALTDNAKMDRWLARRGFEPAWFAVGYTPVGDGGHSR